jgi:cytochrome c oxidase subunit II
MQAMRLKAHCARLAALLPLLAFFVFTLPTFGLAETQPSAATPWGTGLIKAASPLKEKIHDFHQMMLPIIFGTTAVVLALLVYVVIRFRAKANPTPSKTTHNTTIEIVWTAIPVLILLIIVVPSLRLLYYTDRDEKAEVVVKVTGHQWYWSYEYPAQGVASFDSYMTPDADIKPGQMRLLDVDNRLILPVKTPISFEITAADVLHSFAMPAFGVKSDAIPGRLNKTWTIIEKEGVYYGQCSELCGTGHGFMPIAVEAVSREKFNAWVQSKGGKPIAAVASAPLAQVH